KTEFSCEITVIYAQKKSPYLNKNLKPLWKYLSESFGGKFDWFELIETKNMVLKMDEKMEHELPNGDKMAMTFAGVTENKKLLRIHLEIADLQTKVRVKDGALFFQAGRKHKNGIIILAIKASSGK
ncbi:MAG: hypothetical protein FJ088_12855, partial [Deltaproteobacteria bacterium]|nr:hypothetical protein [Deltaproteobacteria bacterium]